MTRLTDAELAKLRLYFPKQNWHYKNDVKKLFDHIDALAAELARLNDYFERDENSDTWRVLNAERDALKLQAQAWAQEARTQRATVHAAYQACTGATGEPGDWNGAEPIKALAAERDALARENAKLREALSTARNELHLCNSLMATQALIPHICNAIDVITLALARRRPGLER